jgi:type I restriction enzyme S subunit
MRPYLRVANVLEDRIDTSDILQMNFSPEEYEVYALQPGDILLNDGQSPELVGRPAMYRGEIPGVCYQNHLIRFRSGDAVDPEFALLVFRHYLHSGRFRDVARWTTNIATLSKNRFAALTFLLPSRDEQTAIVAEARRRLDASSRQQESVRQALSRLPEMESELLKTAVAGQLVPNETEGETGAELLTRLGPVPSPSKAPKSSSVSLEEVDQVPQSPPASAAHALPFLAGILAQRSAPVPLPELFRLAGFDRDRPSDVEEFYIALRAELGHSIREFGEGRDNHKVEVIPHATN